MTGIPRRSGAATERRCVYVAMLLPTDSLLVTVGNATDPPWPAMVPITTTTAVVGSPLLLTVRTRSLNPFENIAIDVKPAQVSRSRRPRAIRARAFS